MKIIHRNVRVVLLGGAILTALAFQARADVLEMKNGKTLNGRFTGGTSSSVRLETSVGLREVPISDIVTLTFTGSGGAPAAAATIPAGTVLLVRMMDSVSSQNAPGATFTTRLETDLVVNGVVAVKAGTMVYGKVQSATQAKRGHGQSTLDIRLTQMTPTGSPIPLVTSSYQQMGERSGKKVAKGAAVGAIIGNNTGSGDQGEGAAIGAAATLLKPGQTLTIAPGTLLEFTLTQPVTVPTT